MIDRLRPCTMAVRTTTQAIEMARSFGKEEWSRFQKRITSSLPFYLMVIGGSLIGYGLVGNSMGLVYYLPILIIGNMVFFTTFLFIPAIKKDYDFLRKVIKYELKENERVLPEDLTIKYYTGLPMRNPPNLSDSQWNSLMNKYKLSRISIFLPLILSISVLFVLPVLIADMFSLNIYLVLLLDTLLIMPLIYFLFAAILAADKVKAMLKYEELTGEKTIPEDYRDDLEKSSL